MFMQNLVMRKFCRKRRKRLHVALAVPGCQWHSSICTHGFSLFAHDIKLNSIVLSDVFSVFIEISFVKESLIGSVGID